MHKHNKHKDFNSDDLIVEYLNGRLSKDDLLALRKWLREDDEHESYFQEMLAVWLSSGNILSQKRNKKAYNDFKLRVEVKEKKRAYILYIFKYSAAVLLGLILLTSSYYLGRWEVNNKDGSTVKIIEVAKGSRSRITLTDGTIVWLNAESKLVYKEDKAERKRQIFLEGEGYFEVAPMKDKPFIVKTTHVDIEVFGTKFNTKAYLNDELIEVTLTEGSINLVNKSDKTKSYLMQVKEQAIYSKKSDEFTINAVPVSFASKWITGAHFFNELSLEQIAFQLERSFDVLIVFRDIKKKNLTFYGDFNKDMSLEKILYIMSSSGKFKYKKQNNIVEIY